MSKPKEVLSKYWVNSINTVLKKLKLETINQNEFNTVIVQNTEDNLNITVLCTGKMLVLTLNGETQKLTGGWKHH